jgi:hypothetical protein
MAKKSKYDLTEAKELFMAFKAMKDISEQCSIPYRTLLYHSKKWVSERDMVRKVILKDLAENKKAVLVSLTGNSLDCIDRAIRTLKERAKPPTIQEARNLTTMVAEIDRILRLDDGEPTDIISQHKPATVIELKQKLKADPFYIEDAEFREIKNEETNSDSIDDTNNESKLCE